MEAPVTTTQRPVVRGLFETHLSVLDLALAVRLYRAFTVGLDELLRAPAALAAAGVTPLSFFGEEADEPSVIGWMPAAAVYFRDPDGHMLEYLAMLDEPARADVGIVPWSVWTAQRE